MSEKKVISIRFSMDNKEDMELYARLEQEAGTSASLASVVKTKVRESYEKQEGMHRNNELLDRISETIRREIQGVSIKMTGVHISDLRAANVTSLTEENKLPEKSEDLPNGALDFLE